jgi:hypothetical protein
VKKCLKKILIENHQIIGNFGEYSFYPMDYLQRH